MASELRALQQPQGRQGGHGRLHAPHLEGSGGRRRAQGACGRGPIKYHQVPARQGFVLRGPREGRHPRVVL
eukprot:scaffold10089_cov110-Isochrysis_galbana.AAC.9